MLYIRFPKLLNHGVVALCLALFALFLLLKAQIVLYVLGVRGVPVFLAGLYALLLPQLESFLEWPSSAYLLCKPEDVL